MLSPLAILTLLALPLVAAPQRREVPAPAGDSTPIAAEPTFELEVAFRIMTGSRSRGTRRAAPDEAVELGVGGWTDHAPIFWDEPVLARVTSGEDGLVRATLALPERYRGDHDACVWARIETPGRKRLTTRCKLSRMRVDQPTDLMAFGAGTLVGTVVDESGQPAPGAEVRLVPEQAGAPGHGFARTAEADPLGRFAIHHDYPGTHHLLARVPGLGSGSLRGLVLPLAASSGTPSDAPSEPLQIVLRGGVSLVGRVLDTDGHPVPGLALTAVPAAGFPTEQERARAERDGGLSLDTTRTDRAGRFEFPNLVAGDYTVHGSYGNRSSSRYWREADARVPVLGHLTAPSIERLDLVARAYRIEVTARDFEGRAVDLEQALPAEDGEPEGEAPGAGSSARIRVAPVGEQWSDLRPVRLDGMLVYPVEPDREYVVTWQQLDVPYFEQRVHVAPNRHRLDLPIQLGRSGAPAQLGVLVRAPSVSADCKRDSWSGLELIVRSRDSGHVVAGTVIAATQACAEGTTWRTPLPAGQYVVEVGSAHTFSCVVPSPFPRERYFQSSVPVGLVPGEERTVEVQVGASGYLDFEPLEARRSLTPEQYQALTPNDSITPAATAAARKRLGGVRAVLVSDSGRRVELSGLEVDPLRVLSYSGLDWMVQGWPARGLSALPVGDWTLRLERAGELVLEHAVTITAGEITTVRW